MVNFPQLCLKTLEFYLNFENRKKKKYKMTLQVHDGYFGHFKSKTYFDHFEAFRGTFITLEV